MWPFDEEKAEDPNLSDFESLSTSIVENAPDTYSGLMAMKDAYGEYEFSDPTRANEIFTSYSDAVRKKFDETKSFDYDTTLEWSPVDMGEITPDTSEDQQIEIINKWESENLEWLNGTTDLNYLQAKSQLERGIKQLAVSKRRDFYGKDNYIVTDLALRFGQGAVGPIADLVGAESVNDWFFENTDSDGSEMLGIGGDDSYWSAIASGLGSAGGAVGAGLLTANPAVGAGVYLGASGAGSVRAQYEDAREAEGTVGEALAAAGIEAANQVVQTAAGTKVFGGVSKQILGKSTSTLGSKVYSKIAGDALLEGTTEGFGQVVSNVASNVGQSKDDDVFEGFNKSFAAGFVSGGIARGYGEYASSKNNVDANGQPTIESLQARAQEDLNNVISEVEGDAPPPKEAIRSPYKSVIVDEKTTAYKTDQDFAISESDGRYFVEGKDHTLEAYDALKFVSPENTELINSAVNGHSPDGVQPTLKINEKGELVLESDFLNPDLTISNKKTGVSERVVPVEQVSDGNQAVMASRTRTQQNGKKVRTNDYFIVPGKISDSAGAMKIGEGQKVSKFVQDKIKQYGPETSQDLGLTTEQAQEYPDGTVVMKQIPLRTYFPNSVGERVSEANQFIDANGIWGSMEYFNNQERPNAEDQARIGTFVKRLENGLANVPRDDWKNIIAMTDALSEANAISERYGNISGESQRMRQTDITSAGISKGDSKVRIIKNKLEQKAYEDHKKETGEDTTVYQVSKEVEAADTNLKAVEKEVAAATKPKGKNKEGEAVEVPVPPELQEKLNAAKKVKDDKKGKLDKLVDRLNEVNKTFSPEDQKRLKDWTDILEDTPIGTTDHYALSNALLDLESKYIADGDSAKVDQLFGFWRRNILSGWATQFNNALGNLTSFIGTGASTALTSPQGLTKFLKGAGRGAKLGIAEAKEIIQGKRAGRLTLGEEGTFKPGKINWLNPFNVINETMSRFLSAADSLSVRTNYEAQLEFAANVLGKKEGLNKAERIKYADEKLFRTTDNLKEITKSVTDRIKVLKDAGIETSDRQKKLMIAERMQLKQDEVLRSIADRHSLVSTYLNDPEWFLGGAYRFINAGINELNVPLGNGNSTQPLKFVAPFIRTAANVANDMLNYTVVGFGRAAYTKFADSNIPEQGAERNKGNKGKKPPKVINKETVDNSIEARQTFGKAMTGSLLTGVVTAMALSAADDENPWLQFYGDTNDENSFSVKYKDTIIKLGNTPLAILPVIASAVVDGYKQGKDTDMIIANAMMGSMGAMSDLSFIKSISDFADMFKEIGKGASDGEFSFTASVQNQLKQQGANVASGFIPSVGFLRNLGKWVNGSPVETYNNFRAKMFGSLPFAPEIGDFDYKLNIFGEKIQYDPYSKAGLGRFLADVSTDPVLLWMTESGYEITRPQPVLKLSKTDIANLDIDSESKDFSNLLTPEESRKVLELSGPEIRSYLKEVMEDPDYKTFSKTNQRKIHDRVSQLRAAAKVEVRLQRDQEN